jgi:hypothetical protein
MDNTSAPALPAHVAVIDDIKRDGGAITYNADGDQRVSFPAQLGAIRARRILQELYG